MVHFQKYIIFEHILFKLSGYEILKFRKYQDFFLIFLDQVTPDLELGPKWHPLIVIGNKKSGNKDCTSILAAFRSQLNPAQVSKITRMIEMCLRSLIKFHDPKVSIPTGMTW